MKSRILVASLACLSVIAAAQQSEKKTDSASKSNEVKAPRDLATGQASGRRMNQQPQSDAAQPGAAAREAQSGQASGKTAAQDDWSPRSNVNGTGAQMKNVSTADGNGDQTAVRESPSKASTGLRESPSKASLGKTAVADVDADGAADKSSEVKSPRDAASGQASGKRQHQPIKLNQESAPASSDKK